MPRVRLKRLLVPVDEEPEEDLTVEQVKEKAEAGDARSQTRVSKNKNTCAVGHTWHCCRSCSLTQSDCACVYFWLLGRRSQAFNVTHKNIDSLSLIHTPTHLL